MIPVSDSRPALITGGAGFIGCNIADALASSGHRILIYDSLARPGVETNLVWLRERHGNRIEAIVGDIRDEDRLARAVRAAKGVMGIIPGSMGAKSFIVRGLGNAESFDSCSHGAGRVMSRTQAKREVTVAEHVAATEGVACRKDEGVIDESPRAYKPIEAVMAAQSDLVEIVHTLKQVVCVKG